MAFIALEQLANLYDGYRRAVTVRGKSLLLCQLDGKVFLIENRCPHMDVPLTDAQDLGNCTLRCLAHGIEFNLNTGKASGPLADVLSPIKQYSPVYDGTKIGLDDDFLG